MRRCPSSKASQLLVKIGLGMGRVEGLNARKIVWPWVSYWSSVSLRFLIYEVWYIIIFAQSCYDKSTVALSVKCLRQIKCCTLTIALIALVCVCVCVGVTWIIITI
jgi:hypothetical protein